MPQTVLVSGASSQIGVFLLPLLQERGCAVRALSRQAPAETTQALRGIHWVHPETELRSAPESAMEEPVALVSAGPPALARRLIERHELLRTAVVFSTSSVFSKADSDSDHEKALMADISAEEKRLKQQCSERGLTLVLIRPTLIYGCGLDRNISLLYRFGQRYGFIPLASRADGLRQPVHAGDLARLAADALNYRDTALLEGQACGGSTLSYREMVSLVAACGPRRARLWRLPPAWLAGALGVLSRVGGVRGLTTAMVQRQSQDLVFDDGGFRQALAWQPRPFRPSPADFEIPAEARALRPPAR